MQELVQRRRKEFIITCSKDIVLRKGSSVFDTVVYIAIEGAAKKFCRGYERYIHRPAKRRWYRPVVGQFELVSLWIHGPRSRVIAGNEFEEILEEVLRV